MAQPPPFEKQDATSSLGIFAKQAERRSKNRCVAMFQMETALEACDATGDHEQTTPSKSMRFTSTFLATISAWSSTQLPEKSRTTSVGSSPGAKSSRKAVDEPKKRGPRSV